MTTAIQTEGLETALRKDRTRQERHELSLLLGGRCRACAELLPRGTLLRAQACPLCQEPTALEERERALIVEHLAHRANLRVGLLALAIGLSQLIVGWVPVVSSLVIAGSTAWIRYQIVQPAVRLLSPNRGRVTVWTARIATSAFVAATLIINELVTLLPFVGPVAKGLIAAGEVLFVAWANARYLRWQVDREDEGLPVRWWEIGFLVLAFGALVVSTVGLVAAVFAAAIAVQALATKLIY